MQMEALQSFVKEVPGKVKEGFKKAMAAENKAAKKPKLGGSSTPDEL